MIKLKDVTKIYQRGEVDVVALKDINLTVEEGDFTAIAGPSGSGKTTFLNILGCLDKPTQGKVLLEGTNIGELSLKERTEIRRSKVGFIFQNFNLVPVLSVFENVEYPLTLEKVSKQERKERVTAVLEDVGLSHRINHFPNQLSGGERQRVGIARALVKKPKLILADEPTANIDTKIGKNILSLMKQLNREEQVTFIFSSHDERILNQVEKTIKIRDGIITN